MTEPTFIDALKPWSPRVDSEGRADRMSICNSCEDLHQMTRICSICDCFMPLKTTLEAATCPKGKW